jgi:hypothetical protein
VPGLVGTYLPVGEPLAAADATATMLNSLRRQTSTPDACLNPIPEVGLGWVGRNDSVASDHVAKLGGSGAILDGELYRPETGAASAGSANPGSPRASDAEYLLQGYLREGAAFLQRLEGRFNAALWLADRREFVIICDKFGAKPLYLSQRGSRLACASSITALLSLPWVNAEHNLRGLVQFFTFGQFWNQDTLYSDIQSLGPAALVVFDAASGRVRQERYWRPTVGSRLSETASLEQLDAQFKAAVDDRTRGEAHLGVSLSGGLDARTVLGVIDAAVAAPTCVSLGIEGSLDQLSARRLADLAGCPFHSLVLDQGFLGDFGRHLRDMAALTDGHYLSQCIVMPTLPMYPQLGIRKLLRGHAGELVHLRKAYNFSVDAGAMALRDVQELHDWLFPRLQSHLTAGMTEPIIRGVDQEQVTALAHESLTQGLDAVSSWEHPIDRISQLFLDQRTHRETAMSLSKFDSVVDVRIPYLDGRFVDAVFAAPVELRTSERIQTFILRRRRPEFLAPPNSNTGAPVGASALRRAFCYYRMKVFAKLGLKGFQPYERLGLWLRRELRPLVEGLLLSPECLDRGVLTADAVRGAVRRHLAGEQNHTFLIMAMMILETGFRQSSGKVAAPQVPCAV